MAYSGKRPGEFDDTADCPVCFDNFDTENSVPRILPCSHSLCLACLDQMLQRKKSLVCPQCRKRHSAKNGVQTFPENKYIVRGLQEKKGKEEPKELDLDLCTEHHKPLNLYCQNQGCRLPICIQCITQHNKHDVVDFEEREKMKFDSVEAELKICQNEISTAKNDIEDVADKVIKQIQIRKAAFSLRFDQMIESVNSSRRVNGETIAKETTSLSQCVNSLDDVKRNPEQRDFVRIENDAKTLCQKELTYNIYEYKTSRLDPATVDSVFGELIPKQVVVCLSGQNKCKDFITSG